MSRKTKYNKNRYGSEFPWSKESKKGEDFFRCDWCGKDLKMGKMGRSGLTSHADSDEHQNQEKLHQSGSTIAAFISRKKLKTAKQSTSAIIPQPPKIGHEEIANSVNQNNVLQHNTVQKPSSAVLPKTNQKIKNTYVKRDLDLKAVIIWCLFAVMKHFSYRDISDAVTYFPLMFDDSEIASRMQLGKDKAGYTIVHGLAEYFSNELRDKLKECKHIVVGFDESLNKFSQTQQMDVVVRYWNELKNESQTSYLSSVFLTSTKALDLKQGLIKAVGDDKLNKIIQVSMDGPNVNFSMFSSLKLELTEQHPQKAVLLDIGSCGLHIIHGAFKDGIKILKWGIIEYLRFLYYLFKNSPSRRGHYKLHTLSQVFPKKFCSTRWVENQGVAQRAIEMHPHLQKWITVVESEGKKNPLNGGNRPFLVVSQFVKDKLAVVKLSFFIMAASLVEPFLVEFQSEPPLAPLLYGELTYLTTNIMRRVVKKEVLEKNSTVVKVSMEKENLLSAKEIDIGFATKNALKNSQIKASDNLVLKFMQDCKSCYVKIVEKILKRSPLSYNFTRYISCLDPSLISSQTSVAQKRLENCLTALSDENKLISATKADKITQEYDNILRTPGVMQSMKKYDRHEQRLDKFWMEVLDSSNRECPNLKSFLQMIFIMSHGNAALERGFSVNKNAIVENQTENSLIALRIIHDAIIKAGGIKCIPITGRMMLDVRMAHTRYKEFCQNKKNEDQEKIKQEKERKRLAEEMKELETKKRKLMNDAAAIDDKINELQKSKKIA